MKYPITWHENNLKNSKQSYEQRKEAHNRAQQDLDRHNNEIKILEYQIASAKKEGKDGFDSEKYKRVKVAIPNGYYKKCYECNNFINFNTNSSADNPKKCVEHKGLKFITTEKYQKAIEQ